MDRNRIQVDNSFTIKFEEPDIKPEMKYELPDVVYVKTVKLGKEDKSQSEFFPSNLIFISPDIK